MNLVGLNEFELEGKTILLRVDLNVPTKDGVISDFARINRVKPTIELLKSKGARVLVLSHFGRPKGEIKKELSLEFMVPALKEKWGVNVDFVDDCIGDKISQIKDNLNNGDVVLLENVRFHKGEEINSPEFAAELAKNADIFVNDAFSVSHRAHASTEGIAHILPSCAGLLMEEEINALNQALGNPKKPLVAIVGGAKISTKLELLNNLVKKVDILVLGGGMANSFTYAKGGNIGSSLCEKDMKDICIQIFKTAKESGCKIILPVDGVIAGEFKANADNQLSSSSDIPDGMMMLDIGCDAIANIKSELKNIKTAIWNGPMGAFEIKPFDNGTNHIAQFVAEKTKAGEIVSVAGGGDTVSALENAGVSSDFSYISTAGGAFLEWLEGKELPGVAALSK